MIFRNLENIEWIIRTKFFVKIFSQKRGFSTDSLALNNDGITNEQKG